MNSVISIIVPCYNQAQYLDECLQSVLDQTYQDWECIIVNDGSPDNTEEIGKKWVEKDSRFKYICKENGGLSSARNAGIEIAKGKYILPLDADDRIAPNYLRSAFLEFEQNDNLKVVYGRAIKFGVVNEEWILPDYSPELLAIQNLIYCSGIYKKSDWERVNGYDINMKFGLEDWEFWIAILKDGGEVKKLNEIVFYYRVKEISMITSIKKEYYNYSLDYIGIKHSKFYFQILGNFHQILQEKKERKESLKSRKFAIDLLLNNFFGVTVFKKLT